MRVERNETLGVVMIETLGNFALGTLSVSLTKERINIVEKGSAVKILGPLPYTFLRDASGVSFASAFDAANYLDSASAPKAEFNGKGAYEAGSVSETLSALIENKVEKTDVDINYKALFLSALGS